MLHAQLDRSYTLPGGRHDSPALRGMKDETCSIDVLDEAMEQDANDRGY